MIVTESKVWLVLEYCPGDELYNYLSEHGRLEASKAQRIFTQLVGAVSYVHSKSCVHRDLKLENILLDKNEDVKLVDFGFTREYSGSTSYLQTWCGTMCYSAPEMIKGEKYAGEKVDVWSLGIILYALLCGELPFDEEDESATRIQILKEEPKYSDYVPEMAKDLIKKMLSKRPILRPCLADILKDPWLAEHAPAQQEILKVQQPAPFSTSLEKETLERMRSAGVDIDTVIENVLSQRCDSLAGWWALLIEKEQRKQQRRERKRKEREAEVKAIRRLSAASARLLSLGEINEGEEAGFGDASPQSRGRKMRRPNGSMVIMPDPSNASEMKTRTPGIESQPMPIMGEHFADESRSPSRPPLPPKENDATPPRRPQHLSRGSGSMLRVVTTNPTNPNLLSPQYVPPPQRKRRTVLQQPLREQLAWVKTWFKEGAIKRAKSPNVAHDKKGASATQLVSDGSDNGDRAIMEDLRRTSTSPLTLQQHRKASIGTRPELQSRATFPARPRLDTRGSNGSRGSVQRKRTSISPATLTPHSSFRKPSAGLRGRKSTSSSVSSVRSAYQAHHHHSHSKASSTSSASVASPSGLSTTSARLARSPHSSVRVLPATPTGGALPSSIRVSRRAPPSALGTLPVFTEGRSPFANVPGSPALPVFTRRKRSVFKGPGMGSPIGLPRTSGSRSGSVPRKSGEMILEEDEDEDGFDEMDEDLEEEEVETFGADATVHEDVSVEGSRMSPLHLALPIDDQISPGSIVESAEGMPLTADALAKMEAHEDVNGT